MKVDCSLYLCTDRGELDEDSFIKLVEQAICGGVTLVQLREKNIGSRQFYELAVKLKTVTSYYKVPLLINDRIDICLAADADGVHLGQSDIPCDIARQLLGDHKIIGITAATPELARQAYEDGADYIGSGAVFGSVTKKDAVLLELETLRQITDSVKIPVAAIGGINLDNVEQLAQTGISGIAVVSALMRAEDPKVAASEFRRKLTNIIG